MNDVKAEEKAQAIANCTINTAPGSIGLTCSCGHHRRLVGVEAQEAFKKFARADGKMIEGEMT